MHTLMIIGVGLMLLAGCTLVGRFVGGPAALPTAALVFLPLWLVGAGINMYVGVKSAGYSVADEAPIFLIVFGVPAAIAAVVWWKAR